jgi:uncharacterized heparinase superfamily protein
MESGSYAVVLADVARIGPDYLPGHAHADTLSFELSLGGHRIIVNSGTSEYGNSIERQRQRGTAAHNTVELNHQNSSEVWGGFRVGRRANPKNVEIQRSSQAITLHAGHSGYRWLEAEHVRKWKLEKSSLTINDQVQGAFGIAYFHLHPNVQLEWVEVHTLRIWAQGNPVAIFKCDSGNLSVEEGIWHPEFGRTVPNVFIKIRFEGSALQTRIEW